MDRDHVIESLQLTGAIFGAVFLGVLVIWLLGMTLTLLFSLLPPEWTILLIIIPILFVSLWILIYILTREN